MRLQAVDTGTLGMRMEKPTPINIDRGDPEEVEVARMHRGVSTSPPADWGSWTNAAGEGRLAGMGLQRAGAAYRGGPARYKQQAVSRTQDGKYGPGANQAYRTGGPAKGNTTRSMSVATQPGPGCRGTTPLVRYVARRGRSGPAAKRKDAQAVGRCDEAKA